MITLWLGIEIHNEITNVKEIIERPDNIYSGDLIYTALNLYTALSAVLLCPVMG